MANNLSSRIAAIERLRGASLQPLFDYSRYLDLLGKSESIEAWTQEVAQDVAKMAEEEQHDNT